LRSVLNEMAEATPLKCAGMRGRKAVSAWQPNPQRRDVVVDCDHPHG